MTALRTGFGQGALLQVVLLELLAGQQPTDSTRSAIAGREHNWRADLAFFAKDLPARHVNAFKYVTPEALAKAVAEIDSAIPRSGSGLWRGDDATRRRISAPLNSTAIAGQLADSARSNSTDRRPYRKCIPHG